MIDRNKLADDLTDLFIGYQYNLDYPMPTRNCIPYVDQPYQVYRSNALFNAKVRCLVTGVMQTLDKHI